MKKKLVLSLLAVFCVFALMACGKKDSPTEGGEATQAPTGPGQVPKVEGAVQVEVNNAVTQQTIEGFGAAFNCYNDGSLYFAEKSIQNKVFDLFFKDAKFNIVRFRNVYNYMDNMGNNSELDASRNAFICKEATKRLKKFDENLTVLMSSWSPSGDLKSSDVEKGKGTLAKKNGEYVYDEYGQYWVDLVEEYRKQDVPIDVISIQNECDFVADYENCNFAATESDSEAAYSKAYLATYKALQKIKNPPKMIGPETMSVDAQTIETYMEDVFRQMPESVYGIGHHLYAGAGSADNPDGFIKNFTGIRNLYPTLAKWQTEFGRGNFIDTAQLVQNSLYYENLTAYVFWCGPLDGKIDGTDYDGLIGVDPQITMKKSQWTYPEGYDINEKYYAMRHFSEFIRPGYKRIDTNTATDGVTVSAFVNDDQSKMVAVAVNPGREDITVQLQFANYTVSSGSAIVSQEGADEFYKENNSLFDQTKQTLVVPAKGVVTLNLQGTTDVKPTSGVGTATDGNTTDSASLNVAQGTPQLSGKAETVWSGAQTMKIANIVNGDHGASATFKALHDDKYLYIQASVYDATKSVSAEKVSQKDSVEVFINESGAKPDSYGDGDSHYRVSRDNQVDFATNCDQENFKHVAYETDNGYAVEMAIPLKTIKPTKDGKMGFDISVNDSHSGVGTNYILKWSDTSSYTAVNLEHVGTLVFK